LKKVVLAVHIVDGLLVEGEKMHYKNVAYCPGCHIKFFPKNANRIYCQECSPKTKIGHHEYANLDDAKKMVKTICKQRKFCPKIITHTTKSHGIRYYVDEVKTNAKRQQKKEK